MTEEAQTGGAPPPREPRPRRPRPSGWRRWSRLGLEVLLGVVTGLVILAGFLAWRLAQGPLPIDFLTPRLIAAFESGDTSGRVAIEQTLLVWDEAKESLDLRVRGLTIDDAAGRHALSLPEANLALDIASLLKGEIAVTGLEVVGAVLTLHRDAEGRFVIFKAPDEAQGGEEQGGETQEDAPAMPPVLLLDRLLADRSVASLQSIRFRNATLLVDDRRLNRIWSVPASEILLQRRERGLSGSASLSLVTRGETAFVELQFVYDERRRLADVKLQLTDLSVAQLTELVPEIAALSALETELSGDAGLTMALDGDFARLDFDLALSAGTLRLSGDQDTPPLAFDGGRFAGLWDGAEDRLTLDKATLQLSGEQLPKGQSPKGQAGDGAAGGPTLAAKGQLDPRGPDGKRQAVLAVSISTFPVAELPRLWPADLVTGGRAWVAKNITAGQVQSLALTLQLAVGTGGVSVTDVDGGFGFQDLEIHYLRPMPPITGVTGQAQVKLDGIDFAVETGAIRSEKGGEVAFDPVTVRIFDFDQPERQLHLDGRGRGPLSELLTLLNHPRLSLLQKLGFTPAGSAGHADFTLALDFPLLDELPFSAVEVSSKAQLQQVRLDKVLAGENVTAETLTVEADKRGMSVTGPVDFLGSRFDLAWKEGFVDRSRQLTAKSQALAIDSLTHFLPALAGYAKGQVAGTITLEAKGGKSSTLTGEFDLARAAVTLPELEWSKAAGVAGKAAATLTLTGGRVSAVPALSLQGPGLAVAGAVALDEAGRLTRLTLPRLAIDGHELRDLALQPVGAGWRLDIGGGVLDVRPWFDQVVVKEVEAAGQEVAKAPPITVEAARLDRILLPDGSLEGAAVSYRRNAAGAVERLVLSGQAFAAGVAGGRVEVSLAPDEAGRQRVSLTADNMGMVLQTLGVISTVKGGRLKITGRSTEAGAGKPLAGSIEAEEFHLIKAPLLARILSVALLTGIADALSGEGLHFKRLTGDFVFQEGVLSTKLTRAYGNALGVTTEGSVDFRQDVVNLKGTLVPAYAVNRVLGEIPVLGWLLTGGEGQGFLAVIYHVNGSLQDPQVSVNPLSALTPGFLRGLFDIFDSDGGSGEKPAPTLYPEGHNR